MTVSRGGSKCSCPPFFFSLNKYRYECLKGWIQVHAAKDGMQWSVGYKFKQVVDKSKGRAWIRV